MDRRPLILDQVFEQTIVVEYNPDLDNKLTTVYDNGPDPEFMASLERGDHLRWILEQDGITDRDEQDRLIARAKALCESVPLL